MYTRVGGPSVMRFYKVALWVASTVVAFAASARAAPPLASDDVKIQLITFGRGDRVHQYFGHNAFVVSEAGRPPTVFNYGMFAFGPDMIPNFLRGRLLFWVGTTDLRRTVAMYASQNRDVRLRELNLEPGAQSAVLNQLRHDILPEHREYLYDHYFDNCSTRLRDVLDRALGGQLRRAWSAPARFTLREETRRYTEHDPWTQWMMVFGLNSSVDRRQALWGDAFLPDELEHLFDTTTYLDSRGERVPLVARKRDLFLARRPRVADAPAARWPFTLAIGLALGAMPLLLARRSGDDRRARWRVAFATFASLYGIIAGALGTLLAAMWMFSDHVVTYGNENLLLVNPLTLVAGVLSIRLAWRAPHTQRVAFGLWIGLGVSTLGLLALHLVPNGTRQDVALTATLFAPINLALALASRHFVAMARDEVVTALSHDPRTEPVP